MGKSKGVKYITVLDFEIGRVFQYKVEPLWLNMKPRADYEEYLTIKGHNLSNCEWMVHDIAQVITRNDYREVIYE